MVQYSVEARRNARHLLNIANAVLQGKPILTHAPKQPGRPIQWRTVNESGDLLRQVYRSYRVAGAQQLELPKENMNTNVNMIDTKVSFTCPMPEADGIETARRNAQPGSLWVLDGTLVYLLLYDQHARLDERYSLAFLGSTAPREDNRIGLIVLARGPNPGQVLKGMTPFKGIFHLTQQVT